MIAGWRATGYGCDRTSTHHATKCAGTPRASSTPAQCLVAPAKADIPTADLSSLSSSSPIFQKHKNVFPERFGLVGGLIGVSKDVRFSHPGAPEHDVMTVTSGVSRGTVGQSLRTGCGSSPSRHGPAVLRRPSPRSPGSRARSDRTCCADAPAPGYGDSIVRSGGGRAITRS
jgi:hypothetical protein